MFRLAVLMASFLILPLFAAHLGAPSVTPWRFAVVWMGIVLWICFKLLESPVRMLVTDPRDVVFKGHVPM